MTFGNLKISHIIENNEGKLCSSDQSIFVVESNDLIWEQENKITFTVVMSTDILL